METNPIAIVIFIAVVNERLIEGFITPFFEKFNADKFWLKYIAWATGGLLAWLTNNGYPTIPIGWTYHQVIDAICKRLVPDFDIDHKLYIVE